MNDTTQQIPQEPRVLVADDDQSIRKLVSTIVRREGLEADSAADGAEAIERLKEHEYAVILLDLMMPRVDGFGVIEYLRQNPPETKPVLLVITAYADQKFKQVDPEIVAGVLRKPFEVADIGNLVRLCVEGFDSAIARDNADVFGDGKVRPLGREWHSSENEMEN